MFYRRHAKKISFIIDREYNVYRGAVRKTFFFVNGYSKILILLYTKKLNKKYQKYYELRWSKKKFVTSSDLHNSEKSFVLIKLSAESFTRHSCRNLPWWKLECWSSAPCIIIRQSGVERAWGEKPGVLLFNLFIYMYIFVFYFFYTDDKRPKVRAVSWSIHLTRPEIYS